MSVMVWACVVCMSAAQFAGPGAVTADAVDSAPGLNVFAVQTYDQSSPSDGGWRETVTAASDHLRFQLGRAQPNYSHAYQGRIRPYVTPKAGRQLGVARKYLPRACRHRVETRRGDRLVYSEPCLKHRYKHVSKLPRDCRRTYRDWRTTTIVYEARCLERDGWRSKRY